MQQRTVYDKLCRIDIFGSLTLVGSVGCLLLGISLKSTEEMPWSHPLIWGLLVASAFWGVLFFFVESYYAPYPVMPLRLITQRTPLAVSISYLLTSISAFSMVWKSIRPARILCLLSLISSFITSRWYVHRILRNFKTNNVV